MLPQSMWQLRHLCEWRSLRPPSTLLALQRAHKHACIAAGHAAPRHRCRDLTCTCMHTVPCSPSSSAPPAPHIQVVPQGGRAMRLAQDALHIRHEAPAVPRQVVAEALCVRLALAGAGIDLWAQAQCRRRQRGSWCGCMLPCLVWLLRATCGWEDGGLTARHGTRGRALRCSMQHGPSDMLHTASCPGDSACRGHCPLCRALVLLVTAWQRTQPSTCAATCIQQCLLA
jgi:hypothetical protein